jgi:hypothetical protein
LRKPCRLDRVFLSRKPGGSLLAGGDSDSVRKAQPPHRARFIPRDVLANKIAIRIGAARGKKASTRTDDREKKTLSENIPHPAKLRQKFGN